MNKFKLKGCWKTKEVWLNGKLLSPVESQKYINHSPDGFNWGYRGSGPSQLALAVYLEIFDRAEGYQRFKWKCIAPLPQDDFEIELDI